MASLAMSAAIVAPVSGPSSVQFEGLRATKAKCQVLVAPRSVKGKGALGARCDYIGSTTNLIVVGSTTLFLTAARFGLAPTSNRAASAGLKLSERETGLQTGDPAGFTATDVLAYGSIGHAVAIGSILGLKALGAL
eukprot:TRINITY_DN5111_c0_g1_i1.p1 TRINITY_DN5111_c0_g1~~TRINITY_DN5111_c0_g1_i1.p1  ORF type:complete len:136 (+),score=21.27 TRINITY_DN5111_c0_g1_i1:307-714(+)